MGWGSFWTESTRRGSLAAIAVSLNTRGPRSDEGKTVSQADVWCTNAWKPLDMEIPRFYPGAAGSSRRWLLPPLMALTTSPSPEILLESVWKAGSQTSRCSSHSRL
jgi:hypothetical protein